MPHEISAEEARRRDEQNNPKCFYLVWDDQQRLLTPHRTVEAASKHLMTLDEASYAFTVVDVFHNTRTATPLGNGTYLRRFCGTDNDSRV